MANGMTGEDSLGRRGVRRPGSSIRGAPLGWLGRLSRTRRPVAASAMLGGVIVCLAWSPGCSSQAAGSARPTRAVAPVASAASFGSGSGVLPLGGSWEVWLDPRGEAATAEWLAAFGAGARPPGGPDVPLALPVPGPLEADERTYDYDGVAYYVRRFRVPPDLGTARGWLHFERVDYACRVWLDGALLGEHEGDLHAFAFDCSELLEPGREHVLVVRVLDPGNAPLEGLRLKTTPHAKQSWYENFGGLLGPVELRLERGWSLVDGRVGVDAERESVSLTATLAPPRSEGVPPALVAVVRALDRGGRPPAEVARRVVREAVALPPGVENEAGQVRIETRLDLNAPRRWSPEDPALYQVALLSEGRVLLERQVGFRSLAIEDGDLLLDGRPLRLTGVLWQPHFTGTGGVPPDDETLRATVRAMQASGFDLVRAHVRPAPDAFLDECDRLGLLVLEEPGIGWVEDDPALPARMARELERMVARHAHHPSVIAWGVLNELSGRAYRHAQALSAQLAALDPTRPVLEDSGAFFGQGRMLPPGGGPALAMIDRHSYPPYPLPIEEREVLRTLSEPGGGPVFVSEFGYGTLLDTEAAVRPFRARGTLSAERVLYEGWAATARRARASGEAWSDTGWVLPAAQLQADAAEDMLEALRANPELDLACYTQWQAVSQEASAGVLDPWGTERPVRARLARATRPLAALVFPARPSVLPGEELQCTVVVLNETGRAVEGTLQLDFGGERRTLGSGPWAPGLTSVPATLRAPEAPGTSALEVVLVGSDGALVDRATPRALVVAPRPAPLAFATDAQAQGQGQGQAVAVWAPSDDTAALAFLERWGLARAATPAARPLLALIGNPDGLRERLGDEDWLALWHGVRAGGAAIVLVPDPARDAIGVRFGTARGVRTAASLPEALTSAGAAGNFMARVHVTRDTGAPRLLGRGDEVLSPTSMLVSDLPEGAVEHTLTLGFLGHRIGVPDAEWPLDRGRLHLLGLPLLDALEGEVEPRRDALLARRMEAAAAAVLAGGEAARAVYVSPPPAVREAFAAGWARIDRILALSDRVSPFAGGAGPPAQRPEALERALQARSAALADLLDGRPEQALAGLLPASEACWLPGAEAFLTEEARVLELLGARVTAAGQDDWDRAYDALTLWVEAVLAFQDRRPDEALQSLERAATRLGDA